MAAFGSATIRESVIAGTWYPGSAQALRQTVEGYLARVSPAQASGKVVALVSPHAGYAYSGPTAAHAFAQVRGADYARVVVIGPLHRPIRGSRLGVWMTPVEDAYRTPLGDVRLDRSFIAELGQGVPLTAVSGDQEHSLEIELPFLQVALSGTSADGLQLVPIMAGEYIGDPGDAGPCRADGCCSGGLVCRRDKPAGGKHRSDRPGRLCRGGPHGPHLAGSGKRLHVAWMQRGAGGDEP